MLGVTVTSIVVTAAASKVFYVATVYH